MANTRGHRRHEDHDDHEEHVNHEAWVIPYADMLTLLMALFLVLFAIGRTDAEKSKLAAESFRKAIGESSQVVSLGGDGAKPLEGGAGILDETAAAIIEPSDAEESITPPAETVVAPVVETVVATVPGEVSDAAVEAAMAQEAVAAAELSIASLTDVQEALEAAAEANGLSDDVAFHLEARGLVVTIVTDKVLFRSGSADLEGEGLYLLDLVAEALTHVTNMVSIEGHTDSRPISTSRYPSNWELSTARATSVLRFLLGRHGLSADRLSAAGYGDTRPIADNSTGDGAALNRRVEIVVLSDVTLGPVIGAEPDVIAQPGGADTGVPGQ